MKLRLITKADLKRHLPTELPFRGGTLKLDHIKRGRTLTLSDFDLPKSKRRGVLQYKVGYAAEDRKFGDMLYINRLPRRMLPYILREQLRAMYWRLVRRLVVQVAGAGHAGTEDPERLQ